MKETLLASLNYILIFIGIVLATILIAYLVNRFFRRLINRSTTELRNDPTNFQFLRHASTAIVYIVGFSIAIYMMPNLRALASSLLAGAGILAVAVGFASQHALSNIISGVFIIIFKPFRVGDRVTVGALRGIIQDITLRHTVIRNFENQHIIIPNSVISNEVIVNANFGDDETCRFINVGISYDSDIALAKRIIFEEIAAHPLFMDNRTEEALAAGEPLVAVRLIALADSSVNLRGWAWTRDPADAFVLECDVLESIKLRFDREGIEIPFPHRTIVHKEKK